jgi:hypothetical protein
LGYQSGTGEDKPADRHIAIQVKTPRGSLAVGGLPVAGSGAHCCCDGRDDALASYL